MGSSTRRLELTRIVSSANGDVLIELVNSLYIAVTLDAQRLGKRRVRQVKLAVRAPQATDRLTSGTLGFGPLRLQISRWASIRAHGTIFAGTVVGNSCVDMRNSFTADLDILDTTPAIQTEVVEGDGAVIGWELRAIKFTVWEYTVDASGR